MIFKLDENIGNRGQELLRSAGHDVATVHDQKLSGVSDQTLFGVCTQEKRVLVTLDHDFGQVLRFPPEITSGIVILELPNQATPNSILNRLSEFLALLKTRQIVGELWIIEPGRIRVHQRHNETDTKGNTT